MGWSVASQLCDDHEFSGTVPVRRRCDGGAAANLREGRHAEIDRGGSAGCFGVGLSYLSGKMTGHVRALRLEYGDRLVRLDLKKLTLVADTDEGITAVLRIGSAVG
ncbi:hypothetical protein [Streptomyces sp. col6]|uniref:hypothetical protein n=1 Tax=Streptomyces sp. col6 TaxID=2478958 RepID=UPI0017467236|nr:hypothetical protein [Streptomyces sp. col6]